VARLLDLHYMTVYRYVRHGRLPARREGPIWLVERVYHDREAELQARVDRARVRIANVGPGERRRAIEAVAAFVKDIAALEPPVAEGVPEIDTVCEPVPIDT
jgi:hypothetical protein